MNRPYLRELRASWWVTKFRITSNSVRQCARWMRGRSWRRFPLNARSSLPGLGVLAEARFAAGEQPFDVGAVPGDYERT